MTDAKTGTNPDFPLNEELLESAQNAKEAWRLVRERLEKVEKSKDELSDEVYQRIFDDYQKRMGEAQDEFFAKKTELDAELATLTATREKVSKQLDEHKLTLEELKFRNTLGEFSEEEYQGKVAAIESKLSKFQTIIDSLDDNIDQYSEVFTDVEDLVKQHAASASTPKPAKKEKSETGKLSELSDEEEPVTDDSGFIIEEKNDNYFADVSPHTDEVAAPVEEKTQVESEGAKLLMVNGQETGTVFKLNGGTISLGRADANHITILDPKASRQHTQIQKKGDLYMLVDLNSSNGTYVNGERVDEYVLANGDEIQIGDHVLQFQEQ